MKRKGRSRWDTEREGITVTTPLPVAIPRVQLAAFCERHHIRKLSLFGSVLTELFRPTSDIDILVEFEPGKAPDGFTFAGMELELTELLGRKVDLREAEELSPYFRDKVVASAAVQYERA